MKIASIRTRIQLGVFMMAVIGVAVLCVMIAGDEVSIFRRTTNYQATFSNTAGLIVGSPVRMGGVEIGRIANIAIIPSETQPKIQATLTIQHPYHKLIRKDAVVSLETQGVLGDKFVSLQSGISEDTLKEDGMIQTKEDQTLSKVMEQSTDIVSAVSSTTKKIDKFSDGLPDAATIKIMTDHLIESARGLRSMTERLNQSPSMISALSDAHNADMINKTIQHLSSTAEKLDSIATKIDSGHGTLGALVNDRTLYEDIRAKLGQVDRGRVARKAFQRGAENP